MSSVPSPLHSSLVQAAQAQQTASKTRDRERAATDRAQRFTDQVELRVAAVESAEAIRHLPQNDSEQADSEHRAKPDHAKPDDDNSHVDLTA